MGRVILLALVSVLLCAGTFNDLDAGLKNLVGQNITEGLRQLGYPDSQLKVGDDLVYVWGSQFDVARYSETGNFTKRIDCVVKLIVGPDKLIKTFDWTGYRQACKMYAKRMKQRSTEEN